MWCDLHDGLGAGVRVWCLVLCVQPGIDQTSGSGSAQTHGDTGNGDKTKRQDDQIRISRHH